MKRVDVVHQLTYVADDAADRLTEDSTYLFVFTKTLMIIERDMR